MAKITLADVSNILGNPTSAAATINANNSVLEAAVELLLSRDGETPNQMTADVDLNNNDLLNGGDASFSTLKVGGIPVQAVGLANALKISNNLSELTPTAATARTNLGLGEIATEGALKQSETRQDGGGSVTTIKHPPARVMQQLISVYDMMTEQQRADTRTGLHSSSHQTYFDNMVTLMNPGGTNIPGGAKVFIPSGKYNIDVGVKLQDSIEWIGENKEGTRMNAMGNNPIFLSVGTSANQVGRAAVKNMTLVGAGKSNLHGYGIELVWMNNPLIEDIQFQNLRWCITQEYVVNAFIFGCSSNGTAGTIRGYLWCKAIDSTLFAGFDNTTTISDCYFMAGDLAMLLHGSNGVQMGGNVAMLQGAVRVGAHAETLPDTTVFTPGANNDVIHFQHWDGLKLDTISNDRGIHIVKGTMAAPHDIRINSLWAGNITGTNSYPIHFDGVEDFTIMSGNFDTSGQSAIWLQNCSRGTIEGLTVKDFGGNNSQNAVLLQSCTGINVSGNSFRVHASNTSPNGIRAESSSAIVASKNYFDWRSVVPSGSIARRSILVDTTGSVVSNNTTNNLASLPCVESGTADRNRIHDNPSTAAPTIVGANTFRHHNDTTTT